MQVDEYTCKDQIKVGQKLGLQISHTGLHSIHSSNQNFSLYSLFQVPQI